jgi:hypothetical protein
MLLLTTLLVTCGALDSAPGPTVHVVFGNHLVSNRQTVLHTSPTKWATLCKPEHVLGPNSLHDCLCPDLSPLEIHHVGHRT